MFTIHTECNISENIIELFRNKQYEPHVLNLMNLSSKVFDLEYFPIEKQPRGECDFVDQSGKIKFDAKLPFTTKQVEMLTNGKKHAPLIQKWLIELSRESEEFDLVAIREQRYDVTKMQLFQIMKEKIASDKYDENIIFFFPFQVSMGLKESIFLQFSTDFLQYIYSKLEEEFDFKKRNVFTIYPSLERNEFVLRNLSKYETEYVSYNKLEPYFSYELVGFKS